jgi:hypothetical protein
MLPGMQGEIESELKFNEFVSSLMEEIDRTGKLVLNISEGNAFIFYHSKEQHFPMGVMTKNQFSKLRAQQAFMQGNGRG